MVSRSGPRCWTVFGEASLRFALALGPSAGFGESPGLSASAASSPDLEAVGSSGASFWSALARLRIRNVLATAAISMMIERAALQRSRLLCRLVKRVHVRMLGLSCFVI